MEFENKKILQSCIIGVGIDCVEVSRIERIIEKYGDAFWEKNFSECEAEACKSSANVAQRCAARFAAKEAMSKALGTGFRGRITPKSFWIENDSLGAPKARFDENVKSAMEKLGASNMLISLTHTKDTAQAVAILTK